MKTILMKFAGPMQSWGTDSHFETRHTDLYPSKSAVTGLIGAALGIRRDDDAIRKLDDVKFAVRIDQEGILLKDYHIVRKYKSDVEIEKNYVTKRYYLEDAIFVAAISHEDSDLIEEIYNALQRPYFQLFLGRRSIPVLADFILGISDKDIESSLDECEWQASENYKKKFYNKKIVALDAYGDGSVFANADRKILRQDKVISFSQKHRQFSFRYEEHAKIYVDNDMYNPKSEERNTEHNAFDSVGD